MWVIVHDPVRAAYWEYENTVFALPPLVDCSRKRNPI